MHVKFEHGSFNRFKLVWLTGPLCIHTDRQTDKQTHIERTNYLRHSIRSLDGDNNFTLYSGAVWRKLKNNNRQWGSLAGQYCTNENAERLHVHTTSILDFEWDLLNKRAPYSRYYSELLKSFRNEGVARVAWPLHFWALSVNSSKTVATDFKFDVHVSRDSPDMTA